MSQRRLASNISVMSIAILISRILGLVRDTVMAFFFGGGYLNDAFNVAYNIPNLLRRLFGEGALSTAFVPIYNEIGIKKDKAAQIDFALNVLSILTLFLLVLTAIGIAFAPWIVRALYPGLAENTTLVAIKLTRIIFPYLFFIGLSSSFIAILNSHEYFFMTGLSSALLNIGMILSIVIPYWVWGLSPEKLIYVAGWGVAIGGFLQTIINFPYLKKVGYRFQLVIRFGGQALSTMWKRFVPAMIGIGIREINLIADALMASFLPVGSITALAYGNRLMQLPLGIFAISAGTAVLPLYSRLVSRKDYGELNESMRFTALSLAYVMLPVTTLILALAPDFITILFAHGAFDANAVLMSSQALIFYSLGLIFYSLNQVLTPLFYANGDTKTPMKLAAFIVTLNIILNYVLMLFMQHRGLALSTSITALINYLALIYLIHKHLPEVNFKGILGNLLKSLGICVLIYFVAIFLGRVLPLTSRFELIFKVAIIGLVSFATFYFLGLLLKLSYISEATQKLCKRLRRK
ncbi:MAG: murein biosynthesis integral membrane protein MurJ [Candidatus Cloacimonetes bacterium]|nr:murein biosynthesis integral membrane protein MurJ [Candidatus Cloacimonadota bacterium]MDY0230526.1 murein biosynthesis integral membrane protein MurJ [Candidatus Cloacimonadaceae bacterium]